MDLFSVAEIPEKSKIENMSTPEYLLTLQRQIAIKHVKEEKAQKELTFKKNKRS